MRGKIVSPLNFDDVKIEAAAVSLGNGSRSNGWYVTIVMVGIIIWHINMYVLVNSL